MEWLNTANGILTLLTGLVGLLGTAVGAYFAVRNWFTVIKTKNAQEIWTLIMEVADNAMKEAEQSMTEGEAKKKLVIDVVKSSCEAAGIDITLFLDQLSDYIDETIEFVNSMKKQGE